MSATNNTNLLGCLAADPTIKELPSGTQVAELRLDVSQAGNTKDHAGFFDVAVYGPAAAPVRAIPQERQPRRRPRPHPAPHLEDPRRQLAQRDPDRRPSPVP